MIADLIKDITDSYLEERALRIKNLIDQFNIDKNDAATIVDNYTNIDDQELIAKAISEFQLNLSDAEQFVQDYPNESDWAQVAETADALNVDITDITPDDVEATNEAGPTGDIESSIGLIRYKYILGLGYMVYLVLNGKDIMYQNIDSQTMNDWVNSDSAGNYYLDNIRGNKTLNGRSIELCGCNANACTPSDIAQID